MKEHFGILGRVSSSGAYHCACNKLGSRKNPTVDFAVVSFENESQMEHARGVLKKVSHPKTGEALIVNTFISRVLTQ